VNQSLGETRKARLDRAFVCIRRTRVPNSQAAASGAENGAENGAEVLAQWIAPLSLTGTICG